MKNVDVAIIGAGSAGLSARKEVEKVTSNYVVIDGGTLGTTCARVGCMPSKVLIEVANSFHKRKKFSQYGISGQEQLSIDHNQVMAHVRQLRDRFVRGVISSFDAWKNEHLITKYAKFIDQSTLELGDEQIKAKNVIIATGSKPTVPEPWKKHQKYFIDSDSFFELETLPRKVAVIGLGVIGLELGQALSRLGVEVHGFSSTKKIGGLSDPEVSEHTFNQLSKEFKITEGRVNVIGEEDSQLKIESNGEQFLFEKVFLTMGRTPNLESLGLESLDIPLNDKGIPIHSKTTFQIDKTRIFIAGDIVGERPILHEASDEGRIAGYNAVRETSQCFTRREPLAITFSDPNIAIVGNSYQSLTESKEAFVTAKIKFNVGRAIVMGSTEGMAHIYARKSDGKILGAEFAAPAAEHLSHLLSWAISLGADVHRILSLPFYHPVLEESLRGGFRELASMIDKKPPPLEVLRCQDAVVN